MAKNAVVSKFEGIDREVRVIYVSSYIPRECGIGTYTKDLTNAINELNPNYLSEIMVLDDPEQDITYPWEVKFKINQNRLEHYISAADYINRSSTEVVSLQHEFGLNGGMEGEYILQFVERVKKPLVTTFHTILEKPTPKQKEIIQRVADKSMVVIVMVSEAVRRLQDVYGVDKKKITMIPHGVPDIPYGGAEVFKKYYNLTGRTVLATINLISKNKGLEYAIEAMKTVVKIDPKVLYLIIGKTHPVVIRYEGEKYRKSLKALVEKHGLTKNVKFVNRYIPLEELVEYLRATDIYITPYLDPEQITSGALAYAVGAGKACVSTPYIYAKEVLGNGRGVVAKLADSKSIAEAVTNLLQNPEAKKDMETKAYAYGRHMTWSNVALRHLDLFTLVAQEGEKADVVALDVRRDALGVMRRTHNS